MPSPFRSWHRVLGISVLLTLLGTMTGRAAPPARAPYEVHFVYLVSGDRPVREDFRSAVERAAHSIQTFYADQLGGSTFALHTPVVEVVRSAQNATWFYAHPTGENKDNWGYDNAVSEVRRLLGADFGQDQIWVVYSDGPGNSGRGGGGIAVMPEDDLLGLIGKHPTQPSIARWIGGLGHELGHALGLSHPSDPDADRYAIMGGGFYLGYPENCHLTPADKAILVDSPFIAAPGASRAPRRLAEYTYPEGRFVRLAFAKGTPVRWEEHKSDGTTIYRFDEIGQRRGFYVLRDGPRHLQIVLPTAGGQAQISGDDGVRWHDFAVVEEAR